MFTVPLPPLWLAISSRCRPRCTRRERSELSVREGFLIVTLFWVILSLFSAIPFVVGLHLDLTDALFESVSGFTTTGATVIIGLDEMPRSLLDSLRSALGPHLHEVNLTADKAARICGHDRRRLSRELRAMGTTLSKELTKLRTDKASRALVDTDRKVAEIAEAVGFTDPTVFSRAFKNWTGQSPREYRRTHKPPN